ncbi:hypothetical protein LPJ77_003275, partial [Coemansia sp. RSA 2523]
MGDREWTGSMSYADDIMASRSYNNVGSARAPVSTGNMMPPTNNAAAMSARTLPNFMSQAHSDKGSQIDGSPQRTPSERTAYNDGMIANDKPQGMHETVEDVEITGTRRTWACMTWGLTWWIPSPFLNWCG